MLYVIPAEIRGCGEPENKIPSSDLILFSRKVR
jgi:hypothetical protein